MMREDQLKAAGMESCARHYRDQLLRAQRIAVELARIRGTVTSDDVREEAERRGMGLNFARNWAGSIFRGRGWVKDGFTTSRHAAGHGRVVAVWRLTDQPKRVTASPAKAEPKNAFPETLFDIPRRVNYEY